MLEPWQLALLFVSGLAAGFVDSIAGGGGLITLPVMLSFGWDTPYALGTNKLQATFGSGSAAWHYARAGAVSFRECTHGFLISFAGSVLGTLAIQQIDRSLLRKMVPVLLAAVALYALFKPNLGGEDRPPRLSRFKFDLLFGLLLGFYDGFLGPGSGTFWTMSFVLCLGFNLKRATAHTKIMNLASNLASLLLFLLYKTVYFIPGLAMGAGQLLGARIGASMVITGGTRFIRPVFISVVLAITGKLIYDAFR